MIIVKHGHLAQPTSRAVRSMFEDRKSVFVDLLNWDLPVRENRYELDEFDDGYATYVIVTNDAGDHCGSARLLPTTRRHILGTLFPELCAGSPPAGPNIMEITRFCLSRRQNAAARRQTRDQLISALASYALGSGIRTYTGVAEVSWMQQVIGFGWECRPLGAPVRTSCGTIGALAIEISADTPSLLASKGIWQWAGNDLDAPARAA
jgi:acyl-homoserine lactone synthase